MVLSPVLSWLSSLFLISYGSNLAGVNIMNIISFLEELASIPHHKVNPDSLVNSVNSAVSLAYKTNNSSVMRKCLGESDIVANPTDVVQI